MIHRANLAAYVAAINRAHLACRLIQQHARSTLESMVGKTVQKKNHRPNERTLTRLHSVFATVHERTGAKIYTPEGRGFLWIEVQTHESTPPIGVVYHRAAFTAGDVDASGRLVRVAPIPTHLRCDWTLEEVERLLAERRAAEERAREARAALGPFQDVI